jgi:hypothetical protein
VLAPISMVPYPTQINVEIGWKEAAPSVCFPARAIIVGWKRTAVHRWPDSSKVVDLS